MEETATLTREAIAMAAGKAGISFEDIRYTVVTGRGREFVPFATDRLSEAFCLARGIYSLFPNVATVLDIGADKILAVRCQSGRPMKIAINDRCAIGSGRFLETLGSSLGVRLEEMEEMAHRSLEPVEIQSTCAVFAETEIISSLVHLQKKREDILKGALQALASRIYPLLLKVC